MQRIKGQEVSVDIIVNGQIADSLTDIKSFNVSMQLEVTSEGYLGEKTNRRDDVFNGCKGSIEMHFSSGAVFDFIKSVIDRAKRKEPGNKINIKATLAFPNGELRRVLLPDCYFGEIPMSFGSRTDYGTLALDFECSDGKFIA